VNLEETVVPWWWAGGCPVKSAVPVAIFGNRQIGPTWSRTFALPPADPSRHLVVMAVGRGEEWTGGGGNASVRSDGTQINGVLNNAPLIPYPTGSSVVVSTSLIGLNATIQAVTQQYFIGCVYGGNGTYSITPHGSANARGLPFVTPFTMSNSADMCDVGFVFGSADVMTASNYSTPVHPSSASGVGFSFNGIAAQMSNTTSIVLSATNGPTFSTTTASSFSVSAIGQRPSNGTSFVVAASGIPSPPVNNGDSLGGSIWIFH
jgi:hypothetical protein